MKTPTLRLQIGVVQIFTIIHQFFSTYKLLTFLAFTLLLYSNCFSQEEVPKHKNAGFIDLNGYYDTRAFSVLTINLFAALPHRLHYFSLTNYTNNQDSPDLEGFYAEHNLRWGINKKLPLDLTYQYILRQGEQNDDHRFGLRWRLHNTPYLNELFSKINMTYSVNPMFIQFRSKTEVEYMTIIEHAYKIRVFPEQLNNRVYIAGFADQNFTYLNNDKLQFDWVTEHQLGIRLIEELYAVAEYRINTFLPAENYGLGYGLEYKIIF
ncbi:hypothetical protein JM83_3581 [Gillisia sp. Hel_I_86]|uniref:hypothetical protein n=1 Tax=Gillisia sp. Hel_I_86 TaxID=1249981 RepID=UPI00119955C6|nr:hypothetical protein [Gillisia sp. Hel_I_86]TVZ28450.1 hypothetical protein JM83_3581 [Gillisia sp. Hel_I_86]